MLASFICKSIILSNLFCFLLREVINVLINKILRSLYYLIHWNNFYVLLKSEYVLHYSTVHFCKQLLACFICPYCILNDEKLKYWLLLLIVSLQESQLVLPTKQLNQHQVKSKSNFYFFVVITFTSNNIALRTGFGITIISYRILYEVEPSPLSRSSSKRKTLINEVTSLLIIKHLQYYKNPSDLFLILNAISYYRLISNSKIKMISRKKNFYVQTEINYSCDWLPFIIYCVKLWFIRINIVELGSFIVCLSMESNTHVFDRIRIILDQHFFFHKYYFQLDRTIETNFMYG